MKIAVALWSVVLLVSCVTLSGCGDPAAAEAAVSEWQTRTFAAMQAEGIDPATASDADWKRVGATVAQQMFVEAGGAAPEAEPTMFDRALGAMAAGQDLGTGGLIGLAFGLYQLMRKRSRESWMAAVRALLPLPGDPAIRVTHAIRHADNALGGGHTSTQPAAPA